MFWLLAALFFGQDLDSLKKQFEYDTRAPLNAEERLMFERNGVRVYDLTFDSPLGGKVTAYLTVPAKPGKYAGVVFGHWGPGNRTEFLPEAQIYSRAGAVCVMIDYPWTRPAPWWSSADDITESEKALKLQAQAVIDLRRAIDLLLSRGDVNGARLGYAGHSYGAQFGAILAAVDRRLRTAVLIGGIPDLEAILLEGSNPGLAGYRNIIGEDKIREALAKHRSMAAIEYVPHAAPVPLLFQFARHELNFGVPAMERYGRAASEPKRILWYDTGHELNDPRALADRARWLAEKLKLNGIESALRGAIRP